MSRTVNLPNVLQGFFDKNAGVALSAAACEESALMDYSKGEGVIYATDKKSLIHRKKVFKEFIRR
ncbi:hypothetical protein [Candidatus Magnetomonas plexicatena]|uniref:hypothetical protein n=1 Tax=Candidatus Magnetomonas plexicatena TaxID=2552947 RepID=UPI001100203A|nr:hypothetical protein E2O03_006340 [Nitrospirales bacterium LBB_01]